MSESLRIARVVGEFQPDRGGVARMVAATARGLAAKGVSVDVFSMGPANTVDGLNVWSLPRSVSGATRLWGGLSRGRFDIVHYDGYSSFVPGATLPGAVISRACRIMTTHFHVVGSGPRAARAAFDRSIGWATVRASHQIQVDTQVEQDAIAGQFGVDPARFAIVPPPLAPEFAALAPPEPRGFGADPFRLLFVGRLDPQKGLGTIIDALALLERTAGAPRFTLTVVGRDYLGVQREFERKAASLKAGTVEFLGPVSDERLVGLYASSHALVLASRYEAFGIVLIEAMSRGLPVIATRVGGIPEVVEDGKNGLLVPYGDASALASTISRLASDEALAKRLSEAGPARVQPFLPDRVADLEYAAYRRALAA